MSGYLEAAAVTKSVTALGHGSLPGIDASKPPGSSGVSPSSSLCSLHFPFAAGFTLSSGALRAPCLSVREDTGARWTPRAVEPGQCRGETGNSDSSMESGRMKQKEKEKEKK